jgi:hypothetical protein
MLVAAVEQCIFQSPALDPSNADDQQAALRICCALVQHTLACGSIFNSPVLSYKAV